MSIHWPVTIGISSNLSSSFKLYIMIIYINWIDGHNLLLILILYYTRARYYNARLISYVGTLTDAY